MQNEFKEPQIDLMDGFKTMAKTFLMEIFDYC